MQQYWMPHLTSVKCGKSESSSEEPLFVTTLQFILTTLFGVMQRWSMLAAISSIPQTFQRNPEKWESLERDKKHWCTLLKSSKVSTATMAAAPCQIKIQAECIRMQPHEAQLEHNQSHSEPLLIISLNICPMPPRGSEKRGTIWLMIQNHSPESLNTSASATLFHIVINSRNLSGCLTWICFNENHLIPTKMLNGMTLE